jgi:hypothetical protein
VKIVVVRYKVQIEDPADRLLLHHAPHLAKEEADEDSFPCEENE